MMRKKLLQFVMERQAVAAIEFALILPLLTLLTLGTFELQRALRLERQLSHAAESIAGLVAQRQDVDAGRLNVDFNSSIHTFPETARMEGIWWHLLMHQISHVVFKPEDTSCKADCAYKADVAWIWPTYDTGEGIGNLRRKCGTLAAAPPGATPEGGSIPKAFFGPGAIIAVDLKFRFKPIVGAALLPDFIMVQQGFANTRFAYPYMKLNGSSAATKCAGYP